MGKLECMDKKLVRVKRVGHKKYEVLWSDHSKDLVLPSALPEVSAIMTESRILHSINGPDCACGKPMYIMYKYQWRVKVSDRGHRILKYNSHQFDEVDLGYMCPHCFAVQLPWEDENTIHVEICDEEWPVKYDVKLRLEPCSQDPDSCKGLRQFAIGPRCGEMICAHKDVCQVVGCTPLWVYVIKDSQIMLMDDIIMGNPYVYVNMEFPFLEP